MIFSLILLTHLYILQFRKATSSSARRNVEARKKIQFQKSWISVFLLLCCFAYTYFFSKWELKWEHLAGLKLNIGWALGITIAEKNKSELFLTI